MVHPRLPVRDFQSKIEVKMKAGGVDGREVKMFRSEV